LGAGIVELSAVPTALDETRIRWRVSAAVAKTGRARWVPVPDVLFEAVTALVPRDDDSELDYTGLPGLYTERRLGRQPGTEIEELARVSG
jgi:hypothetical protein